MGYTRLRQSFVIIDLGQWSFFYTKEETTDRQDMALPCLTRGQELSCCLDKKYMMVSANRPSKQVKR